MRLVIALAWRNLWRQRRRSLVTAGAVALVVLFSIAYSGFGGAMENSMYQRLTEASGHVQVRTPGWREAHTLDETLIERADEVRTTVERVATARMEAPAVVGALDVPALLSGESRSRALALHGQDWPEAVRERRLRDADLEGRFLQDDGEIVLGASLAQALAVGLDDDVYVYAPGGSGFGAAAYTVVGVANVFDPSAEIALAWTTLADAQALAAPDAVQRFEIHGTTLQRIEQDDVAASVAEALERALPDLEALTWLEVEPSLAQLLETLDPLLYTVSALFFVLAGLLVLNTVYLSVMERIREFGVIHALGAGDRRVLGMIATESVLLCLLGAAVGTAGGLGIVAAYADGLVIPGLEPYYSSFGLDPVFYLSVEPAQVLFAVGFAVVTALLAALWPAWIASRLEPVEAMRFQA